MCTPIENSLKTGYEEAAAIRNQLDDPTVSLEQHHSGLAQLQTRLERLDIQFSDGVPDPYLQQQYGSLQFQLRVLASLIERLRVERLSVPPLQEPEQVSPPVTTTVSGTLSQYGVQKNGRRVGDGACTYCAISAIKRLFSHVMSAEPRITSDMIDLTLQEGVALSPEDQSYGDFLGLVLDEDEQDLRHVYSLNGSATISGLRDSKAGYKEAIDELYTLAQRNGGYLAAGCTLNPMSYALFINARTNTFYFYDSHGDTTDPTTGATVETGAKAFIKIFNGRHELIKYLNQRHPFNKEHGDQYHIVTYSNGTRVPNHNAYQIVPVSMLAQQNAPDNATPSTEGDEAIARQLQQEEENRVAQLAQNTRGLARPFVQGREEEKYAAFRPRQGTLSAAAASFPQYENREFIGTDRLKQAQASLLQELQTIAKAKNPEWHRIADGRVKDALHFDWFGFPIKARSTTHGGKYQVHGAIIEELKRDDAYMSRYRAIVGLVMKSWGWNLARNIPDANGKKWSEYGIRLYKMRKSLYEFGEFDLLTKVNAWAATHAPKEGSYPPT